MREFECAVAATASEGVSLTLTIGATFGCPFEGEVPLERVIGLAQQAASLGVGEICLADTIGVADPIAVENALFALKAALPQVALRCHFHDTRNTGIANAYAAWRAGASALDASIGGIGGCPFAPTATGNIATEDLAYMMGRMGVATGLSLDRLIDASEWIAGRLGKSTRSALACAGSFPSVAGAQPDQAQRLARVDR
jgi:hydroxymethylglutaryl-CoA lyase